MKISCPDIAGYTLENGKKVLLDNGIEIGQVTITKPPKESIEVPEDTFRIIKCQMLDEKKIHLMVCKPL